MPAYCIDRLSDLHGDLTGARVAVLGLAYRGGVKETAFSGCWPLVEAIEKRGAIAVVEDPLYTDDELIAHGLVPYHLGDSIDAAIVQTDHVEYVALSPSQLPGIRAFVDGRNIVADLDAFSVAGVAWSALGRRTRTQAEAHA